MRWSRGSNPSHSPSLKRQETTRPSAKGADPTPVDPFPPEPGSELGATENGLLGLVAKTSDRRYQLRVLEADMEVRPGLARVDGHLGTTRDELEVRVSRRDSARELDE